MRYVDWPLLGMICAALIGFGLCVLALFHIALYLLTLLIEWVQGRKGKAQSNAEPAPITDHYQGIAESAIAQLEEEWRAKQR
jgi:hypothetical protein